jgi:hypothetical protein
MRPVSASGPTQTGRGMPYTIIATVGGGDIEAGYVFPGNDDQTITIGASRPGDGTRRGWYTLADAYRAGPRTGELGVVLPCSVCLSDAHQPGTTGTFTGKTRMHGEHAYVRPGLWWFCTEIYVPGLCSWGGCGCGGPHASHDITSLRKHAHAVLRAFPAVSKVRIKIVFTSPENKPSVTQDSTATGPVVEIITRDGTRTP